MNGLKVLDLFSGIGGFSVGLERAGMQTVAFCEVDKKAQQVLRKHWPNVPIFDDVTTLKGEQIGTVDVICGGFPCQDISLAGKGAGLEGARSGLWWEFHRLIKEIKPSWVIAENVSALRSRGLDQILRSLAEIGYDAEWHCIPASAVGAKHTRDRIWIIAYPSKQRCDERGSNWEERHVLCDAFGDAPQSKPERNKRERGVSAVSEVNSAGLLANTDIVGTQVQTEGRHASQQVLRGTSEAWRTTVGGFWSVEPNVGRVADGVSGRVDRLKQLGNAVVPQIPELIGRAINAIA
jgi:DNA (cytosine-5)-methyltransferase 1